MCFPIMLNGYNKFSLTAASGYHVHMYRLPYNEQSIKQHAGHDVPWMRAGEGSQLAGDEDGRASRGAVYCCGRL